MMDGGDSLKRIIRRDPAPDLEPGEEEGEHPRVGQSREREDPRTVGEDYYLTREVVDKWAKERLEEMLPVPADVVSWYGSL
jgi:hypothetical protein